jgi:hypothetical protein
VKSLSIVALLIFGLAVTASAQSIKDGRLWIPVDLKWIRISGAPRAVQKRTASAVVVYFGKNGEFVRDDCWLIRDGKSISISNGDPHNQYVGRIVEHMLDGMRIEYRLVRRTVEREGEVLPGPKISGSASVMAKSGLAIQRRFFHRIKLANESDYIEVYSSLAQHYAQD